MANKTFNTRVKNKRDTAANWEAVATTFQPLDGELIIVDTAAGKTRFKVGRYDTSKGRLLYYNEIPFTDEYLYNDLNESQGKIYDTIKGIDDKSIIEMTIEPFAGNDAQVWSYRIGLWQFPKTGFYKINLPKTGAQGKLIQMFARITQDDGTTPEDDWATTNLKRMSFNGGDAAVDSIYALAEYADNSAVTAYRVQFFNFFGFPGTVEVNAYNKTTQKWAHLSVARSDADTANKVGNALTLTKGDTTTTFNGSSAQTVSIPTKTSELTNDSDFTTQNDLDNLTNTVVSYNAQENITDEQKAQARTNIGAAPEPFVVKLGRTYGRPYTDKTVKEIYDAYVSGHIVYIDNPLYYLIDASYSSGDDVYTISFASLDYNSSARIGLNYSVLSLESVSATTTDGWTETYRKNIEVPGVSYLDAVIIESTNDTTTHPSYADIKNYNLNCNKTVVIDLRILKNPSANPEHVILYQSRNNTLNTDNPIFFTGIDIVKGRCIFYVILPDNTVSINSLPLLSENLVRQIAESNCVSFVNNQVLSEDQKKNARDNIGAISSDELVQDDWNQNDTSSPAYIQNRPGGYYNSVASAESGTLSTTDFQDASTEFNTTSYIITNEAFNTNLTNLNITIGKTYKVSWVDGNKEYSYIANAVKVNGTHNDTYNMILGDTTIDFTSNKLIWGSKSKVIVLVGSGSIASTNTIANIKIEELNVIKIPEELLDLSSIESFDPSKNYIAVSKGSLKYTSSHGSAIIGFNEENTGITNYPKVEVFKDELDTSYVNTTQYKAGEIYSSWEDSSTNNIIHGIDIYHDRYTKTLILESKLSKNTKEDLSVRGIATPTQDNSAVNKKYVDDQITTVNNKLGGLTGAMHFIGKATVDITDGSTTDPVITDYDFTNKKEKGDVILGKDDHKEFVWNGSAWEELGDEGSYALKTTTINGKALSDNITLTASDVGAASASTIETMQAAIDSKPSAADAVYTATAESTDGVAYTATVSGIDSLTVGASFIMIPNKASTSKAPTLNVNGLGAKPIRRRLSSLTTSLQQGYSTNWIALNKPFTVVYDGTAWVIEGLTKTDGADVYGAVAQATADAKGNNIADTYATIAMLQSLLPKVTTITLTSNWVGDASPYYQDIALSCVTETSIVDLQPTPEQLNSWQDDGLAFTTLSGNGTVRVYVAGGKPSSAISVQVRVQEVTVI